MEILKNLFNKEKKTYSYVGFDEDNYIQQIQSNYRLLTNPFWYYEKMIDDLMNIEDVKILPLKEFVKQANHQKKLIGLRHDIDADPFTAIRCAKALSKVGLSGSFYFLHSAVYYGNFYKNIFIRNPKVQRWIEDLVIAGSEIGIHNDILGVYKFKDYDGIEHFKEELTWMRACGAIIEGVTSHNNFLTYGAENSEVFQGQELFSRNINLTIANQKFINKSLGLLSFEDLALQYEGTFYKAKPDINEEDLKEYCTIQPSFFDESWAKRYFTSNPTLDWTVDYQAWLIGKNKWIFSGKDGRFDYMISLSKLIKIIKNDIPNSTKILLELHPEFFGGD